jgi:hypothetical protein
VSEFDFEVRLAARLETGGSPDRRNHEGPIVARQLGGGVHDPGSRVVDVALVEPGPEFDQRTAITPETIPDLAIEADVPVGQAVPRRNAFADLDIPPERQRAVVERAAEIGFVERERRDGRELVRGVAAYPDWYGSLIAIENKPDLEEPGDLDRQLRFDVALSLFDRVVLATGSYVTRGHLNRLPDPVGVWRFREGEIEVVREAEPLDAGAPGFEIVEEGPGRTDVAPVAPAEKARARRRIAERAYGKGFRTYAFPECGRIEVAERGGAGGLPYCEFHGRLVDPATECGRGCPGYHHAPAPEVDLAAARARNAPWEADPEGRARRQSGLGRFGND